jgi:hypothetical protein
MIAPSSTLVLLRYGRCFVKSKNNTITTIQSNPNPAMKHSDPVDIGRDSVGPSSSSQSNRGGGGSGSVVPANETLVNALRLHHLSVLQQDEARRRRRGELPPAPQSPQASSSSSSPFDDIYGSLALFSSPLPTGYSPRQHRHAGTSPPTSMNGMWGGGPAASRSAQDARRRHLLGILTAALDDLSDDGLEAGPLGGGEESDLDHDDQ